MESLDSALSLEPRNLEVHHRLTEYWIGKGDVSKARIHFEIVEQQDPPERMSSDHRSIRIRAESGPGF